VWIEWCNWWTEQGAGFLVNPPCVYTFVHDVFAFPTIADLSAIIGRIDSSASREPSQRSSPTRQPRRHDRPRHMPPGQAARRHRDGGSFWLASGTGSWVYALPVPADQVRRRGSSPGTAPSSPAPS